MAGFGSSIKLAGESEYQRALKQINQSLREVSSEMKVVSSAYDKNDKSTQAIAQKSEVLNKKLEEQKNKLSILTTKYNEMNNTYGKNSQAQQQLTAELTKEKAKLDEIGSTLGKTSKEYQQQQKIVDDLENKQVEYNNAVSKAKTEMNQAQVEINKTTKELEDLSKEEQDVTKTTKEAGDGFTVFKGILANLGTQAINGVINGFKSLGRTLISVGKQALTSYADYEQLVGGVDTLFGKSSKMVQQYAANAYKTAGISANQYMEQVTSFSASLISSLGGDTKKAAQIGDMAITDMSDNANKMGTSMEMLQNAYQGFAKQNYTMLDNLKLGYGGTKSEMERLLKDAEKISGVKYDISNLSDVYKAIHVIQGELGITGTTAKEAATTISGSVNSMKASWQNLLTGMADDTANFDQLINNFVDSVLTVGNNILPRIKVVVEGIGKLVSGLLKELVPKLVKEIPPLIKQTLPILINAIQTSLKAIMDVLPSVIDAVSKLIPEIVAKVLELLPQLVEVGIQAITSLINGLTEALPDLIKMLPKIIKDICNALLDNLGPLIDAGIELIMALTDGLIEALPELIDYIPEIIDKLIVAITDNLPKLIEAGIELTVKLSEGLIKAIPNLIAAIPKIMSSITNGIINYYAKLFNIGKDLLSKMINGISYMLGSLSKKASEIGKTIIDKIKNLPSEMLNWGKDMIQGLINGIKGMIGKVGDAAKSVGDKIKKFLHFSRPDEGPLREYEQWMPDFIKGLSNSLEKASPELINQVKDLSNQMSQAMQPNLALNSLNSSQMSSSNINALTNYNLLVQAFEEALEGMKVELDDEEVGRFVKKTVENAIYT